MKPLTIHTVKTQFIVGNIKRTKDVCSHAYHGKWCVNPVNMWVATIGKRLNLENAILGHLVILIHEISHTMTNVSCVMPKYKGKVVHWDYTIVKILREVMNMDFVKVWEGEKD